ncbi:transposable element Tc1 transposase [Caerostris extrusa]|uniref:Transposable element Tc1 transposase n=1 Tax=Caerostris extrusa TaxID=172846 RepID=A0AAV4QWJ8_CAEEX|nr:transposable element Tc1 transposase [Caerostris extrusa]
MPRSSELSYFEKGIIIGYHKCGRSLRDISSYLKHPKSTVAYVIKKWKVSGDCRNVPRVGRPTKLGDRDRRVLTREIRKNRNQPMALIREEFQQASGSIVSMNTIRKEAHLHGFHGRAAAHKPLITKSNRAARLMWCKAHRNWTVEQWKWILWSDESRFILPFGWQGLASACLENVSCPEQSSSRRRWNYGLGVFLLVWTGTLGPHSW